MEHLQFDCNSGKDAVAAYALVPDSAVGDLPPSDSRRIDRPLLAIALTRPEVSPVRDGMPSEAWSTACLT